MKNDNNTDCNLDCYGTVSALLYQNLINSDLRLKQNIYYEKIDRKILQLKPVTYSYKIKNKI